MPSSQYFLLILLLFLNCNGQSIYRTKRSTLFVICAYYLVEFTQSDGLYTDLYYNLQLLYLEIVKNASNLTYPKKNY